MGVWVGVDHLAAGEPLKQRPGRAGRQRLTAEEEGPQLGQKLLTKAGIGQAQSSERGSGDEISPLRRPEEIHQSAIVLLHTAGHGTQRAAAEKAGVGVQHRKVKGKRSLIQKGGAGFFLPGVCQFTGPVQEIFQAPAGDLHSLGASGAARGKDDIEDVLRLYPGLLGRLRAGALSQGLDQIGRKGPGVGNGKRLGTQKHRRLGLFQNFRQALGGQRDVYGTISPSGFGTGQKAHQHPGAFVPIHHKGLFSWAEAGEKTGGQPVGIFLQLPVGDAFFPCGHRNLVSTLLGVLG